MGVSQACIMDQRIFLFRELGERQLFHRTYTFTWLENYLVVLDMYSTKCN